MTPRQPCFDNRLGTDSPVTDLPHSPVVAACRLCWHGLPGHAPLPPAVWNRAYEILGPITGTYIDLSRAFLLTRTDAGAARYEIRHITREPMR